MKAANKHVHKQSFLQSFKVFVPCATPCPKPRMLTPKLLSLCLSLHSVGTLPYCGASSHTAEYGPQRHWGWKGTSRYSILSYTLSSSEGFQQVGILSSVREWGGDSVPEWEVTEKVSQK